MRIEFFEPAEQAFDIVLISQQDPNQYRSFAAMDFFRIFELGDVIVAAQYVIHELFQRAGPLREVHDEVVLQTLIE